MNRKNSKTFSEPLLSPTDQVLLARAERGRILGAMIGGAVNQFARNAQSRIAAIAARISPRSTSNA